MLKTIKNDLKVATEFEKIQYCFSGKLVSITLNVRTSYTLVIYCPLCVWSMDLTGGQFRHIAPLMFLCNKMAIVFFMFAHWT